MPNTDCIQHSGGLDCVYAPEGVLSARVACFETPEKGPVDCELQRYGLDGQRLKYPGEPKSYPPY
ncbi:MAG: hypothetical protein LBE49_00065 [Deltaproteobacteria bacterium]|nr:hypothetical protein [Deltaproteobacteria bacterium]